jgi:crotonobetainyl-CoA:carnitine CoA-transferase CaiB-like acyl-CoA transferase
MSRPLDRLTVVSLEQAIAAPYCTRLLADQGARVIKVERPDGGDFARAYDDRVRGFASHFVWTNRSKESLAVDLKDPRAIEVLRRIIDGADVFVQNLAPGAVERLGLGPRCAPGRQSEPHHLLDLRLRRRRSRRAAKGLRPPDSGRSRISVGDRHGLPRSF